MLLTAALAPPGDGAQGDPPPAPAEDDLEDWDWVQTRGEQDPPVLPAPDGPRLPPPDRPAGPGGDVPPPPPTLPPIGGDDEPYGPDGEEPPPPPGPPIGPGTNPGGETGDPDEGTGGVEPPVLPPPPGPTGPGDFPTNPDVGESDRVRRLRGVLNEFTAEEPEDIFGEWPPGDGGTTGDGGFERRPLPDKDEDPWKVRKMRRSDFPPIQLD